jgi:hypothetical protein
MNEVLSVPFFCNHLKIHPFLVCRAEIGQYNINITPIPNPKFHFCLFINEDGRASLSVHVYSRDDCLSSDFGSQVVKCSANSRPSMQAAAGQRLTIAYELGRAS